jgi:hypothetical protein
MCHLLSFDRSVINLASVKPLRFMCELCGPEVMLFYTDIFGTFCPAATFSLNAGTNGSASSSNSASGSATSAKPSIVLNDGCNVGPNGEYYHEDGGKKAVFAQILPVAVRTIE